MKQPKGAVICGTTLLLLSLVMLGGAEKACAETESVAELRKKAEQGDASAQVNLALMYYTIGKLDPEDSAKAVHWFHRAAEQGNALAQVNLGAMYAHGLSVPQDDAEAVRWFRRAAEQGNALAQLSLGFMYASGQGVPQNDAEGAHWIRLAAEQGHASAQLHLGSMYAIGEGVPQDDAEAARWIHRAAEQGSAFAQLSLGFMYANGRDVPKDDAEAVRWYRRAVEQGNAFAQNDLGFMYANGRGVPQDDAEAVRWFRRAAEQGHAAAQFNLGFMCANGKGVPKDDVEAYAWFNLAATQDDEDAKHHRDTLREGMTANQILEAKKLSEKLFTRTGSGANNDWSSQIFEAQKLSAELFTDTGSRTNGDLSTPSRRRPSNGVAEIPTQEAGGSSESTSRPATPDDIPRLFKEAKTTERDPRKWLFVIGVEDYRMTNDINYSRHSAEWFARAAAKVLGVTHGRRIVLLDDDATSGAIKSKLANMLANLKEGDHVYLYYSGHGIPVTEQDNAPYILPQDMMPGHIAEEDAFRVESLYRKLLASKAEKVIAFMDSCFTGETDGKSVFEGDKAGTRLLPKKFEIPEDGKLAVLTAGKGNQYSGGYADKGHRMFSYFVIRELLKGHKSIGDLGDRVSVDVTSTTIDLGGGERRQDPVLQGNRSLRL